MTGRRWWAVGLLLVLLVAGVVSYYASSHPDGLEYVAGSAGFGDSAEDSPTAEGPLADYGTRGVENARLSGGIAGVIGTLSTLAIGGGLFWLVRTRARPGQNATT